MGILRECPACGFTSDEIRCPRCNTLKVTGCTGACSACKSGCEVVSIPSPPKPGSCPAPVPAEKPEGSGIR